MKTNPARKLFRILLKPASRYARSRRMQLFLKSVNLEQGMRILDVGGTPAIWEHVPIPLNITCLNLPSPKPYPIYKGHHSIRFVDGDGCNMSEFQRGDFDFIFSNSVIEHVGGDEKQEEFAKEILRLSDNYWVQTPHKLYPIEAHCGMFLWWFYPEKLRQMLMDQWKKSVPAWTEMVRGTTVIETKTLKQLFPTGKLVTEWLIFPKALIIYHQEN